jgi:hypothetical protein
MPTVHAMPCYIFLLTTFDYDIWRQKEMASRSTHMHIVLRTTAACSIEAPYRARQDQSKNAREQLVSD